MTLINRVPRTKGTSPLIITSSLKISSIKSIPMLIAREDRPNVNHATGSRISLIIGLRMRFKAVKMTAIRARE